PKPKYSHLPIKLTDTLYSDITNDKIFIDMINKRVIEGKEEIAEYQAQIETPSK
ncbi:12051_t:CDS:1, partial [Funneliformis geosporum]